ncbi:hypothetical protein pdam_00020451, partial [Pocillopora damicornis]
FCFPLLMEKLSSDITDAKIDSLLTLSSCLEEYHSNYLVEHLEPLWTNCSHLTGSDVKLMRQCGRILQAVAQATEPACHRIIDWTFPLLLEQLTQDIEVSHKKNIIHIITNLLRAAKTFHRHPADSPLIKYKEAVSTTLFSFLANWSSTLCSVTVECFMVQLLVEHVTSIVLGSKEASLSHISSAALSQLSRNYPAIIISTVLPLLEMHLKAEEGSAMDIDNNQPLTTPVSHQCVLNTLGALCMDESIIHEVIPRLIEHVQRLCNEMNSHKDFQSQVCAVFQCILNIVEGSIQKGITSAAYFKQSLVPDIMKIVLKSALSDPKERTTGAISKDVLDTIAAILRTVTSNLDIEAARNLLEDFVGIYLDGNSSFLQETVDKKCLQFESTSPWEQTQLVSLLTATLCSARREVTVPRHSELIPRLQQIACHCDYSRSAESGAQCLAGIINKLPEGDELTSVVNGLVSKIWQVSEKEGSLKRATITWLWLTKALVIRSHPLAPLFIDKILSLLVDKNVGRAAGDGFYIIMADYEEVMSIKMHVNYRMMYRQRLFMETSPKLIGGFHSAKPEFKHHYLCALSHLLQWIPKQVLLSEVPNLMPLLVQSLSCDEQSLKLSTLQTMYSLVLDAPEIISRQVTSLVPMLLGLTKFQLSMKVRMEALKCLGALTTLPHHVVYPYKTKVCKALADSVDDKKRLVRKEAVKCRNEWFLLGSSVR